MASADRLIEVFEGARSRAAGPEREHYLNASCREEPDLREQVCSLLEASEEAGDFFDTGVTLSPAAAAPAEGPGDRIGRYKLLKPIGEGGCGIVYMAEQEEPVHRRVALKVIKLGMDTKQVVARFEAERQALAMMDHPNIAKVFDAGATEAGRPYFVMELVPGIKLTDYCDRNNLPTEERLRLFSQVCHAIQHAHQKGIIHRDIKPSNILVAETDGIAVPKVIDFGIAKATEQRLTNMTVVTALEQFIGTPAYMSPEQATMTSPDIDTRSDIYSLGVLLYELLTGRTPFDAGRLIASGIEEIRRTIREEEPLKPSTRLSALTQTDLSTAAASRRTDPPKLLERVRGDLDWIALKCLEKDRTRRYETVSGLARDIEHYLRDEPVLASPPSAWYRFRKLVRRHKGPVLAGSIILMALVAGIIGTTWGLFRAREALEVARKSEREKSEKLCDALIARAKATGLSGRSGKRFESLDIIRQAAQLSRSLEFSPDRVSEMRNAAIASLALPDMYLSRSGQRWPQDAYGLDFDSTHTLYARCNYKGNCSIRRLADDVELHRLPGLAGMCLPQFSADGAFVAIRYFNEAGTLALATHVWNLRGTPANIIAQPGARYCDFRGSQEVALACTDGTIRLFELPSGRLRSVLAKDTLERELVIALHPADPVVAVVSYFTEVLQVRDLNTGAVLASLPQSNRVSGLAWHPDGSTLAVGTSGGREICLYDRTNWKVRSTMKTDLAVTTMAFNAEGTWLAAAGWGSYIEVFEVDSGRRLMATPRCLIPAKLTWNGTRLGGGVLDGELGIWEVADGREFYTIPRNDPAPAPAPYDVAVHPNGRWLAVSHADGFEILDLITGRQLARVVDDSGMRWLLFQPSGALLISSREGVTRWTVTPAEDGTGTPSVRPAERIPIQAREGLSQSRDGSVIAGCNRSIEGRETIAGGWIFHADRPDQPIRIDREADTVSISVSPDGLRVVTATHTPNDAKVWDASDGTLIRELAGRGAGWPRFSPDGRWLSTMLDGGRIFDAQTFKPGPAVGVGINCTFSPDSRLVAIPISGGARLVEHASGRELAVLESSVTVIPFSLQFTSDASRLVASRPSMGTLVWDLELIRRQLQAMDLDWK